MSGLRLGLILYGLLNAVLYSALLPLWEGFDEPFHYGYVQSLSARGELPALNRTPLSDEIWASLKLAPASHVVRRNIPSLATFAEYFQLEKSERWRRRAELEDLPPALRFSSSLGGGNYEAQQAPLAYLLLALPDRIWADAPLLRRVLRLRLICALAAVLAVSLCVFLLGAKLGLPPQFQHAALFLVLSTQMFCASTAHIANDWLAIPLLGFLLLAAISFYERPALRSSLALALVLSAALLTKAYFLIFVPFATALVVWFTIRRRVSLKCAAAFLLTVGILSGPWYLRNWTLYGNLGGLQPAVATIRWPTLWASFVAVPWPAALLASARSSLWLANNTFSTFSRTTLDVMLALVAAAGLLYVRAAVKNRAAPAERLLIGGCLVYAAVLVYSIAVFFVLSGDLTQGAPPWYTQALFPPLACLLLCGLARSGVWGRLLTTLMLGLWTYVIGATYLAKLIPLYGGYPPESARPGALLSWYLRDWERMRDILATTCMTDPNTLFVLTAATLAVALLLCVLLVREQAAP